MILCEPGCCEGCEECLGLGLGCHNRPAAKLMAEVRRIGDGPDTGDRRVGDRELRGSREEERR